MADRNTDTPPMPGRDAIAELMRDLKPADLTEAEQDAAMRPFMRQLHQGRIERASDGLPLEPLMDDFVRRGVR